MFSQMRMAGGRLALILVGASSHLPAVSHQDSLSVTLCQCWIIVGNLFLFGGSELLVLSYISLPRDQDCGEDGLSMTLCHRRGVGKLTVASTKAKYPSE